MRTGTAVDRAALEAGATLPANWYTDASHHERELPAIFTVCQSRSISHMKVLNYVRARRQRKRQVKARERHEREKARGDDDVERKMYGIANRGGGGMHGS